MTTSDSYHHGDLPNALRQAAAAVIEERGLGGFSLREVARRAGVSHNAPAHHFGDVRGLLTSLACEGYDALCAVSQVAADAHDDPVDRLAAMGEAYVELARSHPAHCEVMVRVDMLDEDDPDFQHAALNAYGALEVGVRNLIESESLDADVDTAVWLCWSSMQGLVVLEPKLKLLSRETGRPEPSTRDLAHRFAVMIADGLRGPDARRVGLPPG